MLNDDAQRLCECNPDMQQCPNAGTHPVVFEVREDDNRLTQWVCDDHYPILIEFKLATDVEESL